MDLSLTKLDQRFKAGLWQWISAEALGEGLLAVYFCALLALYYAPNILLVMASPPGAPPVFTDWWTGLTNATWAIDRTQWGGSLFMLAALALGGLAGYGFMVNRRLKQGLTAWRPTLAVMTGLLLGAAGVVGLLMWYFRVGTVGLGDSPTYYEMLAGDQWFFMSQPLGTFTIAMSYRWLHTWGWPPQAVLAVVGCLAGVLWVLFIGWLVWQVQGLQRLVILTTVLPAPGLFLFFGYPEVVPLAITMGLLYLILAWRVFQGHALWPAALAFGLAIGLHGSMVPVLSLSFLVLLGWVWQQGRRREVLGVSLLACLPLMITLDFAVGHLNKIYGTLYGDAMGGGDNQMFVPLLADPANNLTYTLFSAAHLTDVFNVVLLASPLALLLPVGALLSLRSRWQQPAAWFLAALIVSGLGFVMLWNPDLGMQRDIDLYVGPLLLVLVASGLLIAPLTSMPRLPIWAGIAMGASAASLVLTVGQFEPVKGWDPNQQILAMINKPASVMYDGTLEFMGYAMVETPYAPGQVVYAQLFWRTQKRLAADYAAYWLLTQANQANVPLMVDGPYPLKIGTRFSSDWYVGEVASEWRSIALPADLPTGDYELRVGRLPAGVMAADIPLDPTATDLVGYVHVLAPP